MQQFALERLSWLPPGPDDFRTRLRSAAAGESSVEGQALAALARTALNLDQLIQLERALDRAGDRLDPSGLVPLRLALLADGTTDYIAPALRASCLRHGILAAIYTPTYGRALAEVMTPASGLDVFAPDVALISSDCRSLGLTTPRMDPADAAAAVAAATAKLTGLVEGLAAKGVTVILQTIAAPPDPWCGHLDARLPGSPASQVAAVNAALATLAARHAAVVLDAEALADLVGRGRWFDHAYWHRAKVPFALGFVPLYADHVARLLGAIRGKVRKCLVLDLDNTCWGGVIGDDGLEGIRLGQGSADGEAFLAVQAYALSLKARGIVLAVVSKNEDDAARLPFRHHPEMLLREQDIAVFLANWNDKATNLAHVARLLNIGTDALVFLDDNPAERARVRQMLPEVAVPELPDDPAGYPMALAQSGFFETLGLTKDDEQRAEQYRQNAVRAQALEQLGDYDAYLRMLEMVCDIRPFDEVGRVRITQLVNKSNQFNLTTRRYSEADIAAFEADPSIFGVQVRLADSFGDNGMISVVIFRKQPREWICDTWLMSCRVLERRVEEAVLLTVAQAARLAGADRLIGEYLPSAKNRMVEGHFAKLGFAPAGSAGANGEGTRWVLELSGYRPPKLPMTLTGSAAPRVDLELA